MISIPAPRETRASFADFGKRPRRGSTLIEVILALALTVIILGMIGTVVGRQSYVTDNARRNVHTAELANAILNLIADDLKGTQVAYEVVTFNDPALEIPPEEGEEEEVAEEEEVEEETVTEEEEEEDLVPPIGLYGSSSFIRMDTTKARRPGRRWVTSNDEAAAINPISELRTVSYGMDVAASEADLAGVVLPGQAFDATRPVLMRSARDRAVSAFFAGNLGGDDERLFAKPFATEVAQLQFRYGYQLLDTAGNVNGLEWLDEWDTVESGGLPMAVEITLLMNPSPENNLTMEQLEALRIDYTFQRTVQLPTARILEPAEESQ